jgi:uncharacterized metal-binding protein
MSEQPKCSCGGPKMVFACSGAADVGRITDLAARALQHERKAFMCCTAAIAAGIPGITAKAKAATRAVAVDGCPEDCARRILETAGFAGFGHVRLSDLGMAKGASPATDAAVATVRDRVATLL